MKITTTVTETLDAVRLDEWESIAGPRDYYASADGLRTFARLYPAEPLYIEARDETGRLVGALPCYRLDRTSRESPFTRTDRLMARLLTAAGHVPDDSGLEAVLPSMLCGGRQAGTSRVLVSSESAADRRRIIDRLLGTLTETAAAYGMASACMPYADADDRDLTEALSASGWDAFGTDPFYLIEIAWSGIEEYLDRFPQHRRRKLRRDLDKLGAVTISTEAWSPGGVMELAELAVNLKRKYGSPRTAEDLAKSMMTFAEGEHSEPVLITARYDGRLVGYALFVQWRDEWHGRDAGFDYDEQSRLGAPIYFGVALYSAFTYAAERGIREIHYGMGADEAKINRGCIAVEQRGFLRVFDERAVPVRDAFLTSVRHGHP